MLILPREINVGSNEKMTLSKRLKVGEGVCTVNNWRKTVPSKHRTADAEGKNVAG